MADKEVHELVIIKHRRDHDADAHHGGVWKIAYADFMTAMMAFFLVLWLLNSTNKEARISIANYFNPLRLADASMTRKGIRDVKDALPAAAPDGGRKTEAEPGDRHGDYGLFPPGPAPEDKGPKPSETPTEAGKPEPGKPEGAKPEAKPEHGKPEHGKIEEPPPGTKKPSIPEGEMAKDPYGALAKIAAQEPGPPAPSPLAPGLPAPGPAGGPLPGASLQPGVPSLDGRPPDAPAPDGAGGSPYHDPFEPISPKLGVQPQPLPLPAPNALAPSPFAGPQPQAPLPAPPAPAPNRKDAPAPAKPPAPAPLAPAPPDGVGPPSAATQADAAKIGGEIAKALVGEVTGQPAPKVEVRGTDEGVLISLTDDFDFGMFAIGSSEPQAKLIRIMEKIAQILKTRPGAVVVRGHTDGRPYKSAVYDNWRLSSSRAQMAYYMLVRGGLDEKRFQAIEGFADRKLKIPSDPSAAENRRIEILLRKEKA